MFPYYNKFYAIYLLHHRCHIIQVGGTLMVCLTPTRVKFKNLASMIARAPFDALNSTLGALKRYAPLSLLYILPSGGSHKVCAVGMAPLSSKFLPRVSRHSALGVVHWALFARLPPNLESVCRPHACKHQSNPCSRPCRHQ